MDKNKKHLRPRQLFFQANLDVVIVVDGSVSPYDFGREKQLCHALFARLGSGSQLGVVQFGDTAKVESLLTLNKDELYKNVEEMAQITGNGSLYKALVLCSEQFKLSRFPNNAKQIWVVSEGRFYHSAKPGIVQTLLLRHRVTIFAIGVGRAVTTLNKIASPGCSFSTRDFDEAILFLKGNNQVKSLSCQLEASFTYPLGCPFKLGEDATMILKMENVGHRPIVTGARVIFKDNSYFKEKFAVIPFDLLPGDDVELKVKLVPKEKSNKANLDALIQALPAVLEVLVLDEDNTVIACDCSGFFLSHEDFAGDIYLYEPLYGELSANIITFGPPGSGKSTFVNSVCSALGDSIRTLNVAGATRDVVTSSLLRFPLNLVPGFENLKFSLFDVPDVDSANYKGDEMALMMYGIIPFEIDFKHTACTYNTVKGRRSSPGVEKNRRAHVVAFFIPQGVAFYSTLMESLAIFFTEITVKHKRKAIVIISHADKIWGDEDKQEEAEQVCNDLSIDMSSVFFLENYVDEKDKQFYIDKGVLRILLAMISRADDFLTFDKLNPVESPFPAHPNLSLLQTQFTEFGDQLRQHQNQLHIGKDFPSRTLRIEVNFDGLQLTVMMESGSPVSKVYQVIREKRHSMLSTPFYLMAHGRLLLEEADTVLTEDMDIDAYTGNLYRIFFTYHDRPSSMHVIRPHEHLFLLYQQVAAIADLPLYLIHISLMWQHSLIPKSDATIESFFKMDTSPQISVRVVKLVSPQGEENSELGNPVKSTETSQHIFHVNDAILNDEDPLIDPPDDTPLGEYLSFECQFVSASQKSDVK